MNTDSFCNEGERFTSGIENILEKLDRVSIGQGDEVNLKKAIKILEDIKTLL